MTRCNRVDPWGDLHADGGRGLFTGNRGCLVDESREVVRHHHGALWIVCVLDLADRRVPLDAPHHWTPIFFLDDAAALAAGHRPCGYCRRDAYRQYRDAVTRSLDAPRPLSAGDLNQRLRLERLEPGRGLDRAAHRRLWTADIDALPDGSVIVGPDRKAMLVVGDGVAEFGFAEWGPRRPRPEGVRVDVLTPPTSVAALTHGYAPVLHPSARAADWPGSWRAAALS